MLRLTKALALLTAAYAILTMLPWYLLPLGWVVTGTCFAGLLAVGYACGTDTFFNNTIINHIVGQICLIPLMLPFEAWYPRPGPLSVRFHSIVAWIEPTCIGVRS
jgi:fatty acid desaturase